MNEEHTLTIKGFKSKQQVKSFVDWYAVQGEQHAAGWFEIAQSMGKLDVDSMSVDVDKKPLQEDNNLTIWLKIENNE